MTPVRIFLFRAAYVWIGTLVLSEMACRSGSGLLGMLGVKPGDRLTRFGLSLLLGWFAVGTAYLGLALASLFHPLALTGAGAALVLASRGNWERRSYLLDGWREARGLGWGMAAVGATLLPAAYYMLLPEEQHDCWLHHLGAPWQYLITGRAVLEHMQFAPFHVPMPFEMAYALPLILGDDRWAKGIVLMCYVAATAVYAGWMRKEGNVLGAWLGPLTALSGGTMLFLVMTCKSDVPASSLFIAGAVMQLSGMWVPAALLMGMCVGAKMVYGPLVALWALGYYPGRKRIWLWGLLLVIPSVPWWVKTWLATGNPLFPLGSGIIPTLNWGAANREAFRMLLETELPGGFPKPWDWPGRLGVEHLLALLVVPGLLLLGREKRAAWVLVAGQVVTLWMGHFSRYFLPASWLMVLLGAREVGRLPGAWGKRVGVLVGAYALVFVALAPQVRSPGWRRAFMPWDRVQEETFTTFRTLEKSMAGRAFSWRPGGKRAPRLLSVGEWRTYRFPARLLFNGMFGETPVVWRIAGECRDTADMGRKFRQMGCDTVLYNYVSAKWLQKWAGGFVWDPGRIARYKEFCLARLRVARSFDVCDFSGGGFYLFHLDKSPAELVPKPSTALAIGKLRLPRTSTGRQPFVYYLPGAETAYMQAAGLKNRGRYAEAVRELEPFLRAHPEILSVRGEMGFCRAKAGDWSAAYQVLKPVVEKGLMDTTSLTTLGQAAFNLGKNDEADRILRESMRRYPGYEAVNRIYLAGVWYAKALGFAEARKVASAVAALEEATGWLRFDATDEPTERQRRNKLALILGLRADIRAAMGDRAAAVELYQEALRTAPDIPGAENWHKAIGEYSASR